MEDLKTEEILYGIFRCLCRLTGLLPMGIMNEKLCVESLKEYIQELKRRGANESK